MHPPITAKSIGYEMSENTEVIPAMKIGIAMQNSRIFQRYLN